MARKLIGLAEARRIAVESCTRLRSEQVPLEQALGRATAGPYPGTEVRVQPMK